MFTSSSIRSTESGISRPRDPGRIPRQLEGEPGAALRAILTADFAAVGPHDTVGNGEAEAGSLAVCLGSEEWLEDAAQHVGRNPGSGVEHLEADPIVQRP